MNRLRSTGQIVAYDPIRRKGILKVVSGPPGVQDRRVHFAMRHLPEDFKRPVLVKGRELNALRKRRQDATALMAELTEMMVGRRFELDIEVTPRGPRIVRDSVRTLPEQ